MLLYTLAFCMLAVLTPPGAASEEPREVPLLGLEARCRKMRDLQVEIGNGTKSLHKIIQARPDQKPQAEDRWAAVKLARKQQAVIGEAESIIQWLEKEGAAVAFPEVIKELRDEMKKVQRRLESTDVGAGTQQLQKDILDTLQEMVRALR